jgi:hypothetical protein
MIRRSALVVLVTVATVGVGSSVGFACGGLVAPGHAEVLEKATTLSAWHDGFEHYVTGFRFAGTASTFGYIIPLAAVPVRIVRGGEWTLERLEREIQPARFAAEALAAAQPVPSRVQVLEQVRIEALDITVVRGGGPAVAAWARRNGFPLTPDAPSVLGAYASQRAVFALARFDRTEAARRGLVEGQGQTIHFVMRTPGPWVPLRILALGKSPVEVVDADVFVLTDAKPSVAPAAAGTTGMTVRHSGWATPSLLRDLRSDRGMAWVPRNLWLTALQLHAPAGTIGYDLSVDGARPAEANSAAPSRPGNPWWALVLAGAMTMTMVLVVVPFWRPRARPMGIG